MSKNDYIQNKSLKTFFIASVLISVINQVNSMVDGIIVSHFVSPDALSTVGLAAPVLSVIYMLAGMISMGASLLVTKEIGMQNYTNVAKLFTASILSAFVVTAVMALGLYLCADDLVRLLTEDERLLGMLQSYTSAAIIGSVVLAVQVITLMFVKLSGRPDLVTKAVIVECVSNIILDVVLVGGLSIGIAGAAWASTIACLLSALYMMSFLKREDSIIKWLKPEASWVLQESKNAFAGGVPSAVGTIAFAVFASGLNMLVLNAQGADGLFVLSVSVQMLMLCMLVLGGASGAITGIGGVMLGEYDIDGYRSLVVGLLKKCSIALAVFTVIFMVSPELLARTFGATDEMLPVVSPSLRVFCLSILPLGLISLLSSTYLLQGHKALAAVIQLLFVICILPPVWFTTVYCPEYLWHALPFGFWLMLVIMLCCTFVISRRDKTLHWMTLISKLPNDPNVSLSVNYDSESAQQAIDQIHVFLDVCELDPSVYYNIDSCLEEVTYNLIEMTKNTGKTGSFDIRVVDTCKKILITVKDDGKPYNPILKYNDGEEHSVEDVNLALVMINALCPDINYKYMNGINCVYMNFNYAE